MEIKIMVYVALIEGGRFNTHDALCFSTADGREEYIDNHDGTMLTYNTLNVK